ncbi:hypothetical protein Aple_054710 [Acrocarpospora pleiomorpha]|uniref:Mandelate racemase/muconate lactonizing enzyme C-terminal domain-containing protein n=1 Tax=Acrocarpospora pleiomorpha TaxID=90975 RepID=A0A5M3XTF9_9ACTN|nr:mandelate racemase/muconate lactonizing enzyme family protein [Acrocarpospora pleiomorpha]GES22573.1 hypothetical protein Aple_054710 [Acrocarpospora pleiomorpha]
MSVIKSVSTAVVAANFDWTIVRIETMDGQVGWGESFFAPGLTSIIRAMAPLMVGEDSRNTDAVIARLRAAASGAGSVGGIIHNALSGIDAALWDLNARVLGVPLWQMLGGRFHESVRVYADCHSGGGLMSLGPMLDIRPVPWHDDEAVADGVVGRSLFDPDAETGKIDLDLLADRARQAVRRGFDALKFDLDVPGLVPTRAGSRCMPVGAERLAREMVEAISSAAGPEVELAFDLHWRYDMASAVRLARALEGFPILWLEDPLPPENVAGLISLARTTSTPLGGGENLIGHRGFAPLLETGALAVVTPDLGKVGGVSEARRIAASAAERGLAVAPHNIAGPIGTAFAAQVAATWPNLLALEFHAQDVPFFDELVGGELIVGGHIAMSDRPGIGVEPDLAVLRRWAKPGEEFFA